MNDYQKQNQLIRIYRWCRYKPLAAVMALWDIICWVFSGASKIPGFGRKTTLRLIWMDKWAIADLKMGNTFLLSDLIEELK